MTMEFGVLGPLSLRAGGAVITPTAPKPRQLLALLVLHANQIVAARAVVHELWSDNPPRSAQTTVQTYVLHLRKLFAAGLRRPLASVSSDLLVTKVGGYELRVEPEDLDVYRFERLTRAGRAALNEEDYGQAATVLGEALRQWRGDPLVDVTPGPLLQRELVRLEEARLTALESRIEADLQLGLHREVTSELAYLTVKHPLHEGLHAHQIVALYRSGRRCEALAIFRQLRGRLVEEFGLEPSQRLQRIHQAILNADVVVDDDAGAVVSAQRLIAS
jgi:DNA-binding SARP family transcriptional activator